MDNKHQEMVHGILSGSITTRPKIEDITTSDKIIIGTEIALFSISTAFLISALAEQNFLEGGMIGFGISATITIIFSIGFFIPTAKKWHEKITQEAEEKRLFPPEEYEMIPTTTFEFRRAYFEAAEIAHEQQVKKREVIWKEILRKAEAGEENTPEEWHFLKQSPQTII